MQQIERYGVIALVFLLVTIVAVSFWGDSKSPGFWSRLTGKGDGKKEQNDKTAQAPQLNLNNVTDPNVPLSPTPSPTPAPNVVVDVGGANPIAPTFVPGGGNGTIQPQPQTPPTPGVPGPTTGPANTAGPAKPVTQPKSEPIQPTTVPAPTTNEYVVQKGDSLARIAAEKLGSENRWHEIVALNPGLEPRTLTVGKPIQLPAASTSSAKLPALSVTIPSTAKKDAATDKKLVNAPKPEAKKTTKETALPKSSSTYIVQKGDHLTTIAQKELGDSARWKEIVAANPNIDANKLYVGQPLKMPASKHAPVIASAKPTSSSKASSAVQGSEVAVAEKPHVR